MSACFLCCKHSRGNLLLKSTIEFGIEAILGLIVVSEENQPNTWRMQSFLLYEFPCFVYISVGLKDPNKVVSAHRYLDCMALQVWFQLNTPHIFAITTDHDHASRTTMITK